MSRAFRIAIDCDALFDDVGAIPRPGLCFELIRRVMAWNSEHETEVILALVSRRPPDEGWPLLSALHDAGVRSVSGFFTNGHDVVPYVLAMQCDMFMSVAMDDVQRAIDAGVPAAMMHGATGTRIEAEIRIAFDGDAVLLHHEGEEVFIEKKLMGFLDHERAHFDVPMQPGPLLPFLRAINRLESALETKLFRIALVTARSGAAGERAMRTLAHHGVHVDEAMFCGDIPKLEILRAFGAHVFFDDSDRHLEPASKILTAGKVPWRRTALT